MQNIQKDQTWIHLLDLNLLPKRVNDQGVAAQPAEKEPPQVTGVPAAVVAADMDTMLEYLSQFSSNRLYRATPKPTN